MPVRQHPRWEEIEALLGVGGFALMFAVGVVWVIWVAAVPVLNWWLSLSVAVQVFSGLMGLGGVAFLTALVMNVIRRG